MNKILVILTSVLLSTSSLAMTGSYGISSDYVWRGVSQSNGPAVHLGLKQELGQGFYAGVWTSNVEIEGVKEVEGDFYGGFSHKFENNFTLNLGMVAYRYSGDVAQDLEEKFVGMGYGPINIGKVTGIDAARDYEFVDLKLPFITVADVKLHYGDYEGIRDTSMSIKYSLTDSMKVEMLVQSNVRSDNVAFGDAVSLHLTNHF